MAKRTYKPTKALRELIRVLEEALRAGVDSVELEWEGRDLAAYQCLGFAAVGTAPFPKELEVAVLEELVERAGLDGKTKGTMRLPLVGQERELMVKQRESFGETAFTITLTTSKERRAMATSKRTDPFLGNWHIVSMEEWDEESLNEEVQAFIEFERGQTGQFQFGFTFGEIDYRITQREGKPAVEFSWVGHDEMEAVQGRGWAVLEGEELKGEILLHLGDEARFVARRTAEEPKRKRK